MIIQNVMCACNFDMKFTFVCPDGRVVPMTQESL